MLIVSDSAGILPIYTTCIFILEVYIFAIWIERLVPGWLQLPVKKVCLIVQVKCPVHL